ncbi:MAG: PAS domain S-box protein [Smithellaceae bacterium]
MMYLDLILNLALLVALSVVSGFIDKRFSRDTRTGVLLQGFLFGSVAVIGMLRPLVMGPGLIFDGRSVMLSLCAFFFGPAAALVSGCMAIIYRIGLGGVGALTGILTILSSVGIGLFAFYRYSPAGKPPTLIHLLLLGLAVHIAMIALMFTLPGQAGLDVVKRLGLPILLLYPLATILAGKVLADHLSYLQTYAAFQESEERYRLLFEASLDAILLTAPDGRILSANPAACRLFGKSEEEILATGRPDLVDSEDTRLACALEERLKTGNFSGELTFIRKDGSKFPGEVSSAVFQDWHGQTRTSMIIRDITKRKQAEEPVKRLQSLLNETQRISKVGGWEYDLGTKKTTWTDEVYNIHGLSRDFKPIDLQSDIRFYAPDDQKIISKALQAAIAEGKPYDLELQLITAQQRTIWVRTIGQAEWKDGKIIRVFGNIMDITALKEKDRELKRIEWLLTRRQIENVNPTQDYVPPYGDLVSLNTCRFILDAVGGPVLYDIVRDFLDLLDTSAAVYEKNGDYAVGIFSSGWCRFMDASSFALCGTEDSRKALASGRWHCHESCWVNACRSAIETGQPSDIACAGGIRLYAVPIRVRGEVVGAINFGYGDPPRDEATLKDLAETYGVGIEELRTRAAAYESRPPYIIELARRRLQASARLISEIIERKQTQDELREKEVQYRNLADTGLALIWLSGPDKLCTYFNEPWLKFTGRTLEQELGNGWTQGVHPDDMDRCVATYVAAFENRESFDMDYRLRHASGEYRWIRDLGTPNFNSSGDFLGYIGHCFDITGQKKASEEIRILNEDLEQKVRERTAELQRTIARLEETNRVFVGREIKMAELKKRIEALEAREA